MAVAGAGRGALAALPVGAVAVLVLDATVAILPTDPLVGVFTVRRLVVLAGLAALVAGGARLGQFRSRLDVATGLLLLGGVLTTVVGRHDAAPLRGLITDIGFYYLCVGLLRVDPAARRALVSVALLAAVIAGTAALAQVHAGTPTGFCRSLALRDAACGPRALVRATGTFSNPNLLAAAVVLLAPVGALRWRTTTRSARAVSLLLVALAYAGLVVSFSRAAYVAAGAGAVVLGLVLVARGRGGRRGAAAAVAALGLLLVLAVGIFLVSGAALGVRGELWSAALREAVRHPLLGVGLDRAGVVVSARVPGRVAFAHAHNFWLNDFLEMGLLGLLAAVLLTVLALLTAAQLAGSGAARGGAATGSAGLVALVGFFLLSVVDDPANSSRIATLLWFVLALVAAAVPVARERPGRAVRPAQPAVDPIGLTGLGTSVPLHRHIEASPRITGSDPIHQSEPLARKAAAGACWKAVLRTPYQ